MLNKSQLFCIIISFLLLPILIYFSLDTLFLNGDVVGEGIYLDWSCFYQPVHGRYLGEIFERIIGFANFFGIHPMDWIVQAGGILKSYIYSFICLLIAMSFYIKKKPYILFPFYMLLIYFLTIKHYCIEYYSETQFFGYSMQLISLFSAWILVIKYFTENRLPKMKKTITICTIIAFFLGMATEYMNISFLVLLFLIFCYYFFPFLISNKFNIIQSIKNLQLNRKSLCYPIGFFFVSFLMAYCNPSFWQQASDDKFITIDTNIFSNAINLFNEYCVDFYYIMIVSNRVYLISILVMLISIFILKKENYKKFIIIILFILISIYTFYFSLIFIGKTNYDGTIWLTHYGLLRVYQTSILFIFFCVFGKFVDSFEFDTKKSCIFQMIFMFLFCSMQFQYTDFADVYNEIYVKLRNECKETRKKMYKIDLMSSFYIKNNSDYIYLPVSLIKELSNTSFTFLANEYISAQENEITNADVSDYMTTYYYYLALVYNKESKSKIILLPDKEAYNLYLSKGGKFDEKEIEETNFKRIKEYFNN